MSRYISTETQILERELMQYEHILNLLRNKQQYLIESNADGIRQVTFELEEAISKIRNLEKEREKLLENFLATRLTRPAKDVIAWQRAFPDEDITEKDLTMAFRTNERVKDKLRMILNEVARIQDTNRLLIQQGRDVLQSCMECLMTQVDSNTYDSTGSRKKRIDSEHRILDRTI